MEEGTPLVATAVLAETTPLVATAVLAETTDGGSAVPMVPVIQAVASTHEFDASAIVAEAQVVSVNASAAVPGEEGEPEKAKRGRKRGTHVPRWTPEEEDRLRALVAEVGEKAWPIVAERLESNRSAAGVEQHWQIMSGKRKRNGERADKQPEDGEGAPGPSSEEKRAAKAAAQAAKEAKRAEKDVEKEARRMSLLAEKEARRLSHEASQAERAAERAAKEEEKRARAAAKEELAKLPKRPSSAYLHARWRRGPPLRPPVRPRRVCPLGACTGPGKAA